LPERVSALHQRVRAATLAWRRATARLRLRAITSVGARAEVHGRPSIRNLGRIVIGDDLRLASRPSPSHLVTGPQGVIEIGHGVSIGSGAALASERLIHIGDGVQLGRGVMIMDTDFHDTRDLSEPSASVPVIIEEQARIGERVTILKGAHIGAGARVAPGSVVSGFIAAGAAVAGVPARPAPSGKGTSARAASPEAVLDRVRTIVAETFAVDRPLQPGDGPAEIAGWDSLGALRLLLALEDEFDVVLGEERLHECRSIQDLCHLVEG
jgi:acetyltransferase-like isoleucine patch superfamily enzyme/acyl carrier protein